jgi:hypothetical protein
MTPRPQKLIAPPDGWFDPGTEVELVADCGVFGIFSGVRNGQLDEETCPWSEFGLPDTPPQ